MFSPASSASAGPGQVVDRRAAWMVWLVLTTALILSAGWLIRAQRYHRMN
jgi:hypothetical protein